MWNLLIRLNKNLVYAIPVSMLAGIVCGQVIEQTIVSAMKILIIPLTFLMVYPMMVTLNPAHLMKGIEPKLQGSAIFLNFAIIPFIAYLLGKIFFAHQPYMALGLFLASLLPTSGMTISWTGFAQGNIGAAINMTVVGLILGSLVSPFYVTWLMGTTVQVNLYKIVQQIFIVVFFPMLLGFLTRWVMLAKYSLQEFKQSLAPRFPALSTMGVLGIVFVAMSLKSKTILADPAQLLFIFIPLALLYLINFTLSTALGKRLFNRADGIALVYGTVMRNLSIALAIAMNAFGEAGADAALVIALAYIIQVQSAAWYVRYSERIFGKIAVS